jgi:hypothetical protein
VGATFGLLAALALSAPAPINLNLPPPLLPPQAQSPAPPAPNFLIPLPKPPSRPAWLPTWFLPDNKGSSGGTRGSGHMFGSGQAYSPRGGNR